MDGLSKLIGGEKGLIFAALEGREIGPVVSANVWEVKKKKEEGK